ncbi:MAG: glycosyltransferase family 2 protein [Bacteroidetes bacterium]|nr:glycosyltransferase family 2 protein [Bacteroidota bacterium]
MDKFKTAVIIPCYRVRETIADVINAVPEMIQRIYIIDDKCPDKSGNFVESSVNDPRVKVIYHSKNKGVGGAMKTGYRTALEDGFDIMVKIDGDGQMDPRLIMQFTDRIKVKSADYVKGNRFYLLDNLAGMPRIRMVGNFAISFFSKLVSGYWELMDPANGFTAITKEALNILPLDRIDDGYFFENDMLFRLGTFRLAVEEISIESVYRNEKSNLKVSVVLFSFPFKYINRFVKRIFYNYFLRDFNLGSLYIVLSTLMITAGTIFGAYKWIKSYETNIPSTAGTVIIPTLLLIFGMQFFISAVNFDLGNKRRVTLKKK